LCQQTFIEERVQDATGPEREEAEEAARRASEARTETERKRKLVQKLEDRFEAARSRKRAREEEKKEAGLQGGDTETAAEELRRHERLLVDSNVEEAQEQVCERFSIYEGKRAAEAGNQGLF
jgi:hypothetical protein